MAHPALRLEAKDHAMLTGDCGPAKQLAMRILTRMASVYGAHHLIDIVGAHIDSTVYIGEAGMAYAEQLAALGAKVSVPTTLNVSGVDMHSWQDWAVPQAWATKAHRQMAAYQSMGAIPTWTCAPYQTEYKPKFGDQIAWGESNAIVFANSVIGARTQRYPDLLDVCCAITGRVPAVGLHLDEHRAGDVLVRLRNIPERLQRDDSFYPVFGHLLGRIAGDRVPVVEGLTVKPTEDQLKALGAGAASSGAVALFHLVGITPEAPTRDAAFHGKRHCHCLDQVTMETLRRARAELTTSVGARVDLIVLGSPHFSLPEFKQLTPLLAGRKRHPDTRFVVTTSRGVALLARQAGLLQALEDFGGQITVDTCILTSPMLPPEIKTLMTNSAKYAYYSPGLLGVQTTFGSTEDCVRSAIVGRVVRDESLWM